MPAVFRVAFAEVPVSAYLSRILSSPTGNIDGGSGITVIVVLVITAIGVSVKCTRLCTTCRNVGVEWPS